MKRDESSRREGRKSGMERKKSKIKEAQINKKDRRAERYE